MKTSFLKTWRFTVPLLVCLLTSAASGQTPTPGQKLRIGIGATKVGKSLVEDMQRRGKTIEMGRVTEALDAQYTSAFTRTGKFDVIARSELTNVLEETQLPGTIVDPATAAKKGKIKGLQYTVVISVDSFLDEATKLDMPALGIQSIKRRLQLSCVANIYDCSTGSVLESPNFQSELVDTTDVVKDESGNKGERLDDVMVKMARQTAELAAVRVADVLLPAKILRVGADGKTVTINRGNGLGMRVGDVWEVYGPTEEILDPDTGEKIKTKGPKLGLVKITTADPKSSQGEVISGSGIQALSVLSRPPETTPAK